MDPGTLLLMATAARAVGSVVEGVQGYQQGRYEADVAGANAKIARENAALARRTASAAEEAQRREALKSLGRSAAAIAQSGTGTGGSNALALGQASAEAELDALNIRYEGDLKARGNEFDAAMFDAERRNAKRRAQGALISGVIGAGSAVLSGASAYGNYKTSQRVLDAQRGSMRPSATPGPKRSGSAVSAARRAKGY